MTIGPLIRAAIWKKNGGGTPEIAGFGDLSIED
jgi:hypothetical protein